MAEKKEEIKEVREEDNPNYLKFKVPYTFEGKTYEGLDLSGLESVTTEQICNIQKQLARDGVVSSAPELETEYCCLFAMEACNLPYEFYKKLPARDGVQIRAQVTGFLFNEG